MDTVTRIFELLDSTTMEQQEFARLVGVSDDTASNWRRRKSGSYTKYLTQIADVLETTVEYLLTGEKEKPATREGDELDEQTARLVDKLRQMAPEDQELLEAQIDVMLRRRQEK